MRDLVRLHLDGAGVELWRAGRYHYVRVEIPAFVGYSDAVGLWALAHQRDVVYTSLQGVNDVTQKGLEAERAAALHQPAELVQ